MAGQAQNASSANRNEEEYTAALVVIGNEILSGRTQDTNTQWIAERLTKKGVILAEVRVIPDDADMIVQTVNDLRHKYSYVFTTGGIGPTHDDITAENIARAFDVKLKHNDDAYKMLEDHYGADEVTSARIKMALIPEGASLIPNSVSGAPGFVLENVYVMAGVPRIMQSMLDYILNTIDAGQPVLSSTVSCSLQESELAEELGVLQGKYQMIEIGSYPHYRGGIMGLSLVLRGTDREQIRTATEELVEIIRAHDDEPQAVMLPD